MKASDFYFSTSKLNLMCKSFTVLGLWVASIVQQAIMPHHSFTRTSKAWLLWEQVESRWLASELRSLLACYGWRWRYGVCTESDYCNRSCTLAAIRLGQGGVVWTWRGCHTPALVSAITSEVLISAGNYNLVSYVAMFYFLTHWLVSNDWPLLENPSSQLVYCLSYLRNNRPSSR